MQNNTRKYLAALALPAALLMGGCSHANTGPYGGKSVAWYVKPAHEKAIEAQLVWCLKQHYVKGLTTTQSDNLPECKTITEAVKRVPPAEQQRVMEAGISYALKEKSQGR